jgi:hypothetical protein
MSSLVRNLRVHVVGVDVPIIVIVFYVLPFQHWLDVNCVNVFVRVCVCVRVFVREYVHEIDV